MGAEKSKSTSRTSETQLLKKWSESIIEHDPSAELVASLLGGIVFLNKRRVFPRYFTYLLGYITIDIILRALFGGEEDSLISVIVPLTVVRIPLFSLSFPPLFTTTFS